ncbi:MAG: hypothetical protein KAS32_14355 [Candidatus Peribacteraceae bacterium]|nr:hypothetical protein [Candidatus Peribacteraceae bacterium]
MKSKYRISEECKVIRPFDEGVEIEWNDAKSNGIVPLRMIKEDELYLSKITKGYCVLTELRVIADYNRWYITEYTISNTVIGVGEIIKLYNAGMNIQDIQAFNEL